MKKYFNEEKEQFKMEKGTIKELKYYQGRVQIYLTQDPETLIWRFSFNNIYKIGDKYVVTKRISALDDLTTVNLAKICGYDYDEDGNYIIL